MTAIGAVARCLVCASAVAISNSPCDADTSQLQRTVVELSSHGSRMPGYSGDRFAADYVEQQLRAAGVQDIHREPFDVTVPIDKGASLEFLADGTMLPLWSLWPNLVRTSTVPPAGVEAELIYGGQGRYEDLEGQHVEGRIVLMEFNSAHRWRTPAALGARAVVFLEPDETTVAETRRKWSAAPVDLPRFWIEMPAAAALKERVRKQGAVRVRLKARMDWERHTTWNIWGIVPGTDPGLKDELVAVEAYYDGTSVVPGLNPSAEGAASIATLIEFARSLRENPPGRSVLVLASGAHFVRKAGIVDFVNRHARESPLFKARMARRLDRSRIDVAKVVRRLQETGMSADSLGLEFVRDADGELQLEDVDLPQLSYELTRAGLETHELGLYTEPDSLDLALFIGLDMSSHSNRIAVWNTSHQLRFQRVFAPLARSFVGYAEGRQPQEEERHTELVNGISPPRGRTLRSYLSGAEAISNGAIARGVGILTLELRTVEDPRLHLDSPLDRVERVDFESLDRQSELVIDLLHGALSDHQLYGHDPIGLRAGHDQNIKDEQRTIYGALQLPASSGSSTGEAAPFGLASLAPDRVFGWRPWIVMADENGDYRISGLPRLKLELHGFLVDPTTGGITHATDRGEQAQKIGLIQQDLTKEETAWTTVLFPATSLDLYERIFASRFFTMGDWNTQVLDQRGITPRSYGYSMAGFDDEVMVLFGAEGDSLRIVDGSVVLLANATDPPGREALGTGFLTSTRRVIPHVTLQSARDMWKLDESRLQQLRSFSIENPMVEGLHESARLLIDKAESAQQAREWVDYARFAREALALEFRAYPKVKGTQNDVMSGLVFFVAILLPAVFFLEKLLFAATEINRQLLNMCVVFLVSWATLSQVHPAFDLASPVVILLAVLIGVTGLFVIAMLSSRFNAFMLAHRLRQGGTDVSEMSRSGALYAAFALGISNMRRRVLRTSLTLTTITLLAFTVLSFTSFIPSIRVLATPSDGQPTYRGMLLQDPYWWAWSYPTIDYVRSHFEEAGTVVPRTWRFNNWHLEGDIPLTSATGTAQADAVLGFAAAERLVTGIDRSLVAGRWFEDDEENSVIISETLADELGLVAEAGTVPALGASLTFFGRAWNIVGVFDPVRYEDIRDLNNEPMTPIREEANFLMTPGLELDRQKGVTDFEQLEGSIQFGHLPAQHLIIVPHARLAAIGANDYTVAVRFDDGVQGEELIRSFLDRSAYTVHAGVIGDAGQLQAMTYTSVGVTSIKGLVSLILPGALAALIVLNTMMGSVYERFREIGVYSSVGLAPVHISFLFLAEACVYAVLGVVFGYILGQGTSKVLIGLDMLSGVSVNYSSMAAVVSAIIVIAVVLLSAIYPAVAASRIAVPDVVRRWQIPTPDADVWRFIFPFTVNSGAVDSLCGFLFSMFDSYSDESVGDLYTDRTRIVKRQSPKGPVHSVQLGLWLAPFDLGVSQYLEISMYPSETQGIDEVEIYIERLSGPLAHWHRLNQDFAIKLRRQFLIWQTMREELRQEHADTGRRLIVEYESLDISPATTGASKVVESS